MRPALPCTLLAVVAASCSSPSGTLAPERIGQSAAAIAYGTADTTHTAVVSLLANAGGGDFAECSGSIVQVSNDTGYVLTAAHCCNNTTPTIVVAANDYASGEMYLTSGTPAPPSHAVVAGSVWYDSAYNGQDHDFCMLQFSGATGMPTLGLPTSSADGLSLGIAVEHVGYGSTETNANNSTRRTGTDTVDLQLTSLIIQFSQGGASHIAGTCEGDSGGPALLPAGAAQSSQIVVATTSYGSSATCSADTAGVASRVSSEIGPGKFITSYLANTPVGTQAGSAQSSCDTCSMSAQSAACSAQASSCSSDAKCLALSSCLPGCNGDPSCETTCETTAGAGAVNELNAFDACICDTACTSQCASECAAGGDAGAPSDAGASCGVTSSLPACNTCLTASCCAEAAGCAGDQTCAACLVASPAPSCDANALYQAFGSCIVSSCSACVASDAGMAMTDAGLDSGAHPDAASHADGGLPGHDAGGGAIGDGGAHDAGRTADSAAAGSPEAGGPTIPPPGDGSTTGAQGAVGESSGCATVPGRGHGESLFLGLIACVGMTWRRRRRSTLLRDGRD